MFGALPRVALLSCSLHCLVNPLLPADVPQHKTLPFKCGNPITNPYLGCRITMSLSPMPVLAPLLLFPA